MSSPKFFVKDWYDQHAEVEDKRLELDKLEYHGIFYIIQNLVEKLQSKSSSIRIADIGCGTGRYAIPLAREGHEVSISDISSAEIDLAKQKADEMGVPLEWSLSIDARHIRYYPEVYRNSYYDLELWLGPLYHIMDPRDRTDVILAALDTVRPGGFIATPFVTKNEHLRDVAARDPNRIKLEWEFYSEYLTHGRYTRGRNAAMHHTSPKEIHELLAAIKEADKPMDLEFDLVKMISCEGFLGFHHGTHLVDLDNESFAKWPEVILQTAEDETTLGSADHLLVILQRKL